MTDGTSTIRLYLMRASYLLNFVILGASGWPGIINHSTTPEPMRGIAVSF